MQLKTWGRRAVIACATAWILLVAIYLTLGAVSHETLDPPFNALIMILLATATAGSSAAWLGGWLWVQIEARLDSLGDGRLYFEMARIRGEVAQLRDLIEQTTDLTRPLALVGDAYDAGYTDGLSRHPIREAKILPMEPRSN